MIRGNRLRNDAARRMRRETHIRVYRGDNTYLETLRRKYGKKSIKDTLNFVLRRARNRRIV